MFWLNDIVSDIVYDIVYDIVPDMVSYIVYYIVYLMLTLHFCLQDCVCLVAPYPYRLQQLEDFDPIGDLDISGGGDLWYARPLLFFRCTLCPTGKMGDARTQGVFTCFFQHI